jgi:hypothetical protein
VEVIMVIKGTFLYPPESEKAFTSCVKELPPLPEYVTVKGPFCLGVSGKRKKTITLYEFKESRFAEASKHIFKQLEAFRGVPGFTFSAQVWEETREALKSIGLALGTQDRLG